MSLILLAGCLVSLLLGVQCPRELHLPSGPSVYQPAKEEIQLRNYHFHNAPLRRPAQSPGPRCFRGPGSVISAMASADSRRMGNGGGVGGAFQPYLDSLRQELQQRDPTLLSVVVALLAVLLTLGKEVAGGYGGCGAGGDPSSDWASVDRGAELAPEGRLEWETQLIYSCPPA